MGQKSQTIPIEFYIASIFPLENALSRFSGSQGLLRCAAQSVADAGESALRTGASQSDYNEVCALRQFTSEAGLWVDAETVNELLRASCMLPGKEHRVAYIREEDYVIKVADVQALATESLYDYLTDLLLSNYFFDDDLQIVGCYEEGDRLKLVTKQPYVDGRHPDWEELRRGLVAQGLRDPNPLSKGGNFIIDDPVVGEIDVYDLHVNNVILDTSGRMNPIDAHFYFDDRASRVAVLKALGLDAVAGPSDLIIFIQDNESDFFKP